MNTEYHIHYIYHGGQVHRSSLSSRRDILDWVSPPYLPYQSEGADGSDPVSLSLKRYINPILMELIIGIERCCCKIQSGIYISPTSELAQECL